MILMFDWLDVAAGVLIAIGLVRVLPNKWIIGSFEPKTKWGKRKLRNRLRGL